MSDLTDITELAPPPAVVAAMPSPPMPARPAAAAWPRVGVALLAVLGWILLLYRETAGAMVSIWQRSDTFAHAFLVLPIVLWLVWRRRTELATQLPRPAPWVLLPLAVFALAWLLGDLATVNALSQFALVALLVTATVALLGASAVRPILFPLGFMFFAVPTGEFLMPQLMEWTADVTVFALRLSGIPVFREGLSFVIPSGSWLVAEACSGVRYLIASLMVGTLFAYLSFRSPRRRLVFIAASIGVPIVANWVRAYMIVMLGHLSGNKLAAGVDHLVYGWLFFGLVIMLMFWIGSRWSEPEASPRVMPALGALRTAPLAIWPALLAAVIVTLPQAATWAIDKTVATAPVKLVAPDRLSSWTAGPAITEWKPGFADPSAQLHTVYVSEGRAVGLYVGYYRNQDSTRKLVASSNVLVPSTDPRWQPIARTGQTLEFDGRPVELRSTRLRPIAADGDLLVWQTYWVNGRFTSNDAVAKLQIALGKLMGQGDDAAVLIVYSRTEPAAAAALEAFLIANLAAIETELNAARSVSR